MKTAEIKQGEAEISTAEDIVRDMKHTGRTEADVAILKESPTAERQDIGEYRRNYLRKRLDGNQEEREVSGRAEGDA